MLSTAQPMLNASPPELSMLQPVLVRRGVPGGLPMPVGGAGGAPFAPSAPLMDLEQKAIQLRSDAAKGYRSGNSMDLANAAKAALNGRLGL